MVNAISTTIDVYIILRFWSTQGPGTYNTISNLNILDLFTLKIFFKLASKP